MYLESMHHPKLITGYLQKAVSPYADFEKTKIVSKAIVRNKNKPTEFTEEFVDRGVVK